MVIMMQTQLGLELYEIPPRPVTLEDYLDSIGQKVAAAKLSAIGKVAAILYRHRTGRDPVKFNHGPYGKVNAYPPDLAQEVLTLFGYA
jgi:hypothetical protein